MTHDRIVVATINEVEDADRFFYKPDTNFFLCSMVHPSHPAYFEPIEARTELDIKVEALHKFGDDIIFVYFRTGELLVVAREQ